jgi:hypothetical protein
MGAFTFLRNVIFEEQLELLWIKEVTPGSKIEKKISKREYSVIKIFRNFIIDILYNRQLSYLIIYVTLGFKLNLFVIFSLFISYICYCFLNHAMHNSTNQQMSLSIILWQIYYAPYSSHKSSNLILYKLAYNYKTFLFIKCDRLLYLQNYLNVSYTHIKKVQSVF